MTDEVQHGKAFKGLPDRCFEKAFETVYLEVL